MADIEENWLEQFGKESTPSVDSLGYVPLPTVAEAEPQGSVWMAHWRQENTIGSLINRHSTYDLDSESRKDYNFANYISKIPVDLLDYADRFYGSKNDEEFNSIEAQIRQELKDKALLAANPLTSLAYSLDPLEPLNWLPGANVYKKFKTGSRLARSIAGTALHTAASVGAQEAILHQNQLTRTLNESLMNTAASGLVGGVLGGIGTGIGIKVRKEQVATYKARQRMHKEISSVLVDAEKELTNLGTLPEVDLKNMPKPIRKAMNITPMNQLLNSEFNLSRWFSASAYENNYSLTKYTGNESIESAIKLDLGKVANVMVDYQDHFFDMHGVSAGKFKGVRSKLSQVDMNRDQFDDAVSLVLTTEQPHPVPQVNEAAKLLRNKVFDPYKDQAIAMGILPKDATVKNAVDYFMILYNKNKIIEQGGRSARGAGTFPQYIYDQFKLQQEVTKQYLSSPLVTTRQAKIKEFRDKIKARPQEEIKVINESISKIDSDIKKIKNDRAKLVKQKGTKASTALGKFDTELKKLENEKERLKKSRAVSTAEKKKFNESIETLEKEIIDNAPDKAKTWDNELHDIYDDGTLWSHVEQTVDNILGNKDGKLLNPMLTMLRGQGGKPVKSRKLLIDQAGAREWHITNAPKVAHAYTQAMVPMLRLTEFAQRHGFKDIDELKIGLGKQLKAEFDLKAKGKTGKEAQRLQAQFDKDMFNIKNSIDLLMGVYGDAPNVMNNKAREYYQNFLKWNYTRLLGYMTLSSLADAGGLVFTHGTYRTLHDGILRSTSHAKAMNKTDLKAIGYGIETELGTRIKSYMEHAGLTTNPSPFTKSLDSLTQNFGNLSFMNQWNDLMHNLAGHMSINRSLETIHKVVHGDKVAKKDLDRLARLGITEDNFNIIYNFTKNNIDETGAYFSDWGNWDITNAKQAGALRQFQASVGKEINSIVVVPGLGDKPLLAHEPAGKLLFQFKTFLMAMTNKVLYSGIQRRDDMFVYQGVAAMLSLGALSYITTSLVRGDEPDLSYEKLSREALDRSGLTGIWGEVFNIGQKVLGFNEVSRYKSRDIWGSLVGPSGGAVTEMLTLMNKVKRSAGGEDYLTTKDAEKLLRLMPLQNLFYLHKLNRQVVKGAAEELGAIPVD